MKHFYDLRTVDDLADGEIATPEPGITYDLRTINNRKLDVGSVVDVIRPRSHAVRSNDQRRFDRSFPATALPILVPHDL